MLSKLKYGSQKAIDDQRDSVAYWLKLAPTIWPTKTNKIKALNRFIFLSKGNLDNKKTNDAKIEALTILIKK